MHERFQKRKGRPRAAAALCLSALLLASVCTGQALAAAQGGTVSAEKELIPVGCTVGVKLFARGVLVVDLADGETPAVRGGLSEGDVILKCAKTTVTSTEQFQGLLQNAGGQAVELQIRRSGALRTLSVTPRQDEQGNWMIGAWIRDSMAGIGTMTFYDPDTGVFGALGHGVADPDTAQLMPFSAGAILRSSVKAVKRGENGTAGELRGDFDLTGELGELYANTSGGIFGTLEDADFSARLGEPVPVAAASEVHAGKAVIYCNVSGAEVEAFRVEITRLSMSASDPRDLLITVTDPRLLEKTGGIVQGMSGSPILQDGKLVGAVTHVLLNDPAKGYGILIETMLKSAEKTEGAA